MQDLRFSQRWLWRMLSSGTLRRVAFVRFDVSEEPSTSIIRGKIISELGKSLAVTSNRRTTIVPSLAILVNLMKKALGSSETSVLTRDIWCKIPEDGILHVFLTLKKEVMRLKSPLWTPRTLYIYEITLLSLCIQIQQTKVGIFKPEYMAAAVHRFSKKFRIATNIYTTTKKCLMQCFLCCRYCTKSSTLSNMQTSD
jgi:hypothetical protein